MGPDDRPTPTPTPEVSEQDDKTAIQALKNKLC